MHSPDHLNAGTSVSCLIPTIIAPHAGNLAKEMTPASQISLLAISVQISLKNSNLRLSIDVSMSENKKASDPCNTSKDDDLDLLGDDVEAFSGSQAHLEGAANNLFSPRPKPLLFESLPLKTPTNPRYCLAE